VGRIVSWIGLGLSAGSAFAQTSSAAEAPVETSGPLSAIVFGILFVGFCVGVVWMMWRSEKKKASDKDQ